MERKEREVETRQWPDYSIDASFFSSNLRSNAIFDVLRASTTAPHDKFFITIDFSTVALFSCSYALINFSCFIFGSKVIDGNWSQRLASRICLLHVWHIMKQEFVSAQVKSDDEAWVRGRDGWGNSGRWDTNTWRFTQFYLAGEGTERHAWLGGRFRYKLGTLEIFQMKFCQF